VALTLGFTGQTRLLNLSGNVTFGVFATHSVTGQYHYKPVVSPAGKTFAQACANKVAPNQAGRVKVSEMTLFRTKHLIIG
jgi:hypothetical protein